MEITSVRIHPVEDDKNLFCFASIVFDEEFVIHNLRLVRANSGLIVAMPNEKYNGDFRDIAHPITNGFREQIHEKVVQEYNDTVESGHQI